MVGTISWLLDTNLFSLVTRNTKDFAAITGLRLENWFSKRSASAS